MLAQVLSDGDARRGREVVREVLWAQAFATPQAIESGDRFAERAGDVNAIARFCSGAPYRFALGHGANHHDVGEHACRALRGIATGERNGELFRQREKAFDKTIDPALRKFCGKSQGKKGGNGLATHGSDIA